MSQPEETISIADATESQASDAIANIATIAHIAIQAILTIAQTKDP